MKGRSGRLAPLPAWWPVLWRFAWRAKWVLVGAALLGYALPALRVDAWMPRAQSDLASLTVYAYRQWQSTGQYLEADSVLTLRARGEWMYSPYVGLHGPRGGLIGLPTYPLAEAPGGALIGRIGERGAPFDAGAERRTVVRAPGLLYLRINDDVLSDNRGQLTVEIQITEAPR